MYALEVNDLRKTYKNGVEALKGVSLTVDEGDFFALLGPNGAGKSTLLKAMLGLNEPTTGRISVLGAAPVDVRYIGQQLVAPLGGDVFVVPGVVADLKAARVEVGDLFPGHVALFVREEVEPFGNVEGGAEIVARQQRRGEACLRFGAVVKREDHQAVGDWFGGRQG